MRFFGVNEADIPRVFTCENFVGDYEFVSLKSEVKDDKTTVRLKFKETV